MTFAAWRRPGLILGGGLAAIVGLSTAQVATAGRAPMSVSVLDTRFHEQCPVPGVESIVRTVRSPQEWATTVTQDEQRVLGRKVQWDREEVLVYAMDRQPILGVSIEPASRVLSLRAGVLIWPIRELRPEPDQMAATALSRPCLLAVVRRSAHRSVRMQHR